MAIIRNTAGQGLYVYAHDTATDEPETGDALNITATISLDGGAPGALTDVNPTEIGGGVYWFTLTQAETNAAALVVVAVSATADVQLDPVLVLTQEVGIDTRAIPGDAMTLEAGALADIEDAVWDAALADHPDPGSAGAGLAAASAAGDPWAVELPGAYPSGSAGRVFDQIRQQTDLLGTQEVAILSPVLANGDVEIVRGDVYEAVDGRMLIWESAAWDIPEEHTTIVIILQQVAALIGERLSANRVGLELSHAQSVALPQGLYPFSIQEIQDDGDPVTLLRGRWVTLPYPEPRPGS